MLNQFLNIQNGQKVTKTQVNHCLCHSLCLLLGAWYRYQSCGKKLFAPRGIFQHHQIIPEVKRSPPDLMTNQHRYEYGCIPVQLLLRVIGYFKIDLIALPLLAPRNLLYQTELRFIT